MHEDLNIVLWDADSTIQFASIQWRDLENAGHVVYGIFVLLTATPSGVHEFNPCISGVRVVQSVVFRVVFCRSLVSFWSLFCMSFFDIRIYLFWLPLWYRCYIVDTSQEVGIKVTYFSIDGHQLSSLILVRLIHDRLYVWNPNISIFNNFFSKYKHSLLLSINDVMLKKSWCSNMSKCGHLCRWTISIKTKHQLLRTVQIRSHHHLIHCLYICFPTKPAIKWLYVLP